ncbi:hypothetical protein Tco_1029812 [Tanacetum coccineum]|uniref:Uncharacterized protein n=1 Tax=Tanacetum coccineum TaxID=301880 RepID=A0ABQ5G506_9ASTR
MVMSLMIDIKAVLFVRTSRSAESNYLHTNPCRTRYFKTDPPGRMGDGCWGDGAIFSGLSHNRSCDEEREWRAQRGRGRLRGALRYGRACRSMAVGHCRQSTRALYCKLCQGMWRRTQLPRLWLHYNKIPMYLELADNAANSASADDHSICKDLFS